jgi:hypothetical protein
VYRKAFCRTLPIEYSHTGELDGLEAYWFQLTDNAFESNADDPESTCYCDSNKKCLKKGLGKITPCYYSEYHMKVTFSSYQQLMLLFVICFILYLEVFFVVSIDFSFDFHFGTNKTFKITLIFSLQF